MLNSVHFQLTRRCNLRCPFCGQNHLADEEAPPEQWLRTAAALPEKTAVTLWGGEPLLYPGFAGLARELFRMGRRLSVVTNGTLIEASIAPVLNECFREIFLSVDGDEAVHDRIRGPGNFAKIKHNLEQLAGRRGRLIFLTTISDWNVGMIADLPDRLAELHPDRVVLQPLIYLSSAEIDRMPREICREELRFWRRNEVAEYETALRNALREVEKRSCPVDVTVTRHACSGTCFRPWHTLHIAPDGEGRFCPDFAGFSAGNVFRDGWEAVFHSGKAKAFRRSVEDHRFPGCDHCPWRIQAESGPFGTQ